MADNAALLDRLQKHLDSLPDDKLAHHGVLGMKWGIRKDRNGKYRPTKEVLAEKKRAKQERKEARANAKRERRKEKVLRGNRSRRGANQNRSVSPFSEMSNQELNEFVTRLRLEQQLMDLTTPAKKPSSRMQTFLRDITYDASKQAFTNASRMALEQALKTIYSRSVPDGFKINNIKK